jgi:hypothetical protein
MCAFTQRAQFSPFASISSKGTVVLFARLCHVQSKQKGFALKGY